MKNIFYKLSFILITFLGISCTEEVEFNSDTEALGGFEVISPVSATNIILNSGTPENVILFNWANAKPGVSKEPTYNVSLFLDEEDITRYEDIYDRVSK